MSSNVPGYAGKILRVNLSDESITEEKLDANTLRKYVGGSSLGARYLYDEVPPGVEWFAPENHLIFASGPLGGTRMMGSGSFSVVTKGSLTNGAASTQANGFFGAFLKFSGFDAIVVYGVANRWVYLYLHDGIAELRDASHLIGKSTWETEDLIKGELGKRESEMSVFSIGPAGENLVKFAGIIGDRGHAAAHNGVGAVMGSKKLKAVAADRGKGPGALVFSDRTVISAAASEMLEYCKNSPSGKGFFQWGTLNSFPVLRPLGALPIRNYTTNIFPDQDKFDKYTGEYIRSHFEPKPHPCWACQQHHCHILKITEGPYAGYVGEEPEYEGLAAWGSVTGPTDVAAAIMLSNEVDRLGFDTNEAGWVIGLVMECYEKGILTKDDTDGIEMTWGNVEATRAMLNKIARREGFGDVLAEGVMRAAQKIGGGAPKLAIHTMKGTTPRGHDHRALWLEMLDTCVSSVGTIENSWAFVPDQFGLDPSTSPFTLSPSDVPKIGFTIKGSQIFEDSLVVCRFCIRNNWQCLLKAINGATGWDFTFEEAMKVGRRAINIYKVFNLRHGLTEQLDAPSARYGSIPKEGPSKGKNIMHHWEQIKRDYYELMGWDRQTSKPLPQTLSSLGLEDIIADI